MESSVIAASAEMYVSVYAETATDLLLFGVGAKPDRILIFSFSLGPIRLTCRSVYWGIIPIRPKGVSTVFRGDFLYFGREAPMYNNSDS